MVKAPSAPAAAGFTGASSLSFLSTFGASAITDVVQKTADKALDEVFKQIKVKHGMAEDKFFTREEEVTLVPRFQ